MPRPPLNSAPKAAESRLKEWPAAPEEFTEGERRSWARLGRAVMAGQGVTAADLLMAERLAQLMARHDAMLRDEGATDTALNAIARLEKELLIQLGLSPAARKGMVPPDPESEDRKQAEALLDE